MNSERSTPSPSLCDFAKLIPETAEDPCSFYKAMREEAPIHLHEGVYFISRWEDITFVAERPDIFRVDVRGAEGADHPGLVLPDYEVDLESISKYVPRAADKSDGFDHKTKRRWVLRLVERARMSHYETVILALADELIDTFVDRGECEFRSEFADPLPLYFMCDLLGFPRSDAPKLQSWTDDVTAGGAEAMGKQIERTQAGWRGLNDYVLEKVIDRYEHPGGDIISELMHAQIEQDGTVDINFQVSQGVNLLLAGAETTAHMLANILLLLCRHPGQLERATTDRSFLSQVVEESLRLESPIQWLARLCTETTKVGGVTIPKGAVLALLYGSGNRDAAKFENPDTFDPGRLRLAKQHLAFGRGIHLCAGAPLARLEGEIGFQRLFARLQNIRLDETRSDLRNIARSPDEPSVPQRMHGPTSLVITFESLASC